MTTREELQAALMRMDTAKQALLECLDRSGTISAHQAFSKR